MFILLYGPMWYYYLLDILTYILILPGIIFSVIASARVRTVFSKYSRVPCSGGMTGAEAARKILLSENVPISVVPISGTLTDNYDPRTQTLNLSKPVFGGSSVASLGVAAHEAGHAIQHAEGYIPFKIRSALVTVTNIGCRMALPLAIIGVLLEWLADRTGGVGTVLIAIGIALYSLSAIFALVTLPVELNASRRAKKLLVSNGALTVSEAKDASKVLNAAALTYVASLAVSLLYLLRFVFIISRMRRKD